MIVPQAIFTSSSLRPLMDIWAQLESGVSAAFAHPRSNDIRGEFSVLANAWKALAMDNTEQYAQFRKTKPQQQLHEEACTKRVTETYNDFMKGYNDQRRTTAVALGSLWTCPPEQVVAYPGKPSASGDPIAYALQLANFHEQYWTSALGFLHYMREVLNLHDASKTLSIVAQTIETQYFGPLQKLAHEHWLTLLVIGGSAADLQLAREKLASHYISGTYETRAFLNSPLGSDAQNAMSDHLRNAFARAMAHPRSDPETPVSSTPDLGL